MAAEYMYLVQFPGIEDSDTNLDINGTSSAGTVSSLLENNPQFTRMPGCGGAKTLTTIVFDNETNVEATVTRNSNQVTVQGQFVGGRPVRRPGILDS